MEGSLESRLTAWPSGDGGIQCQTLNLTRLASQSILISFKFVLQLPIEHAHGLHDVDASGCYLVSGPGCLEQRCSAPPNASASATV